MTPGNRIEEGMKEAVRHTELKVQWGRSPERNRPSNQGIDMEQDTAPKSQGKEQRLSIQTVSHLNQVLPPLSFPQAKCEQKAKFLVLRGKKISSIIEIESNSHAQSHPSNT